MTDWQLRTQVELPLASRDPGGVRGGDCRECGHRDHRGGHRRGRAGLYIFRGVAVVDDTLILAGALPAALMALRRTGSWRPRTKVSGGGANDGRTVAPSGRSAPHGMRPPRPDRVVPRTSTESDLLARSWRSRSSGARRSPWSGASTWAARSCATSHHVGPDRSLRGVTRGRYTRSEAPPVADTRQRVSRRCTDYAQRFRARLGPAVRLQQHVRHHRAPARRHGYGLRAHLGPRAPGGRAGRPDSLRVLERADVSGRRAWYGLRFASHDRNGPGADVSGSRGGEGGRIAGNSTDGQIQALDLVVLETTPLLSRL